MRSHTYNYSDDFARTELGPWAVDAGSVLVYGEALHTDLHANSAARYLRPGADASPYLQFATQRATLIGTGPNGTPSGSEVWALQFFGQGNAESGPMGWLDARLYLNSGYLMIAEQSGNIPGTSLFATEPGLIVSNAIIGNPGVTMYVLMQPAGGSDVLVQVTIEIPGSDPVLLEHVVTPSVSIDMSQVFMRFRSHNGAGIADWSGFVAWEDKPITPGDPVE